MTNDKPQENQRFLEEKREVHVLPMVQVTPEQAAQVNPGIPLAPPPPTSGSASGGSSDQD